MKWIFTLAAGLIIGKYMLADDPNAKPSYGASGRPNNCRALVQANIDGYRSQRFSADDALASIERNCGARGSTWKE